MWMRFSLTGASGRGALLCAALLACGPAPAAACAHPFTVATGQWEPYAYYDAQQRFTGIDADMTRAIFKEAGCVLVELGTKPAVRNLALFEKGEIDLMTGASINAERLKLAHFSVPYRDETIGLFALADGAARYSAVRSFQDFLGRPLTLLAPKAGWYGAAYNDQIDNLKGSRRLSQFLDYAQGIRMLAAGRADFILGDAAGIEHAAARQGVKVQPLPFWLVQSRVHLMFSRATTGQDDVQRIDAAIARLQRRGVFEQIRRSYGGM
jgi:polar amino acid transport system substrate-binding protein